MIADMHPSLNVTDNDVGQRLDVFLSYRLGKTRSSVQKLIQRGEVSVNDTVAVVHRFLKKDDAIVIQEMLPTSQKSKPAKTDCVDRSPVPTIVKETKDWIVVDKPVGLLVHPDAQHPTGTLVDWLIAHDPKIARVGEDPNRPGIVHRLDREVSGLIVVAKTQEAYEDLQQQFRERKTQKIYLALAHGRVREEEGEIKFRIARSTTQPRMAARPSHETIGRAAWSHYRVLDRRSSTTLLEIEIYSGRSHQIRAHLQAIGHPIVGDTLYATSHTSKRVPAPRLMLQSIKLAFHDPTSGKRQTFSIDPDPAFQIKPS